MPDGALAAYPLLALEGGRAAVSLGSAAGLRFTSLHVAAAMGDAPLLALLAESLGGGGGDDGGLDAPDEQGASALLIAAACALAEFPATLM